MKIRNLAILCLVTLLAVYCGTTLYTLVYTTANRKHDMLLGLVLPSKNSETRPGLITLGDPVIDCRPH